jgi:hypothetical protein
VAVPTKVFHIDPALKITFCHNALIVDVAGDMDIPRMLILERAYRALLADYPKGIVSLSLLRSGVPIASSAARNQISRAMKELGDSVRRVAMVIEAKGVGAQMLATVVRGINVFLRNPKLVLCNSLEDAIRGLAAFAPDGTSATFEAELRAAVTSARVGFPAPPIASAAQT